ncbi:hypothetical protein DENSPDRAFT_775344 [Dentipellis sp. KUC8613]|nr:hypothetical protein DENSPDRAFT_775344 [Dentipellis sp. KUC8613]
MTASSSPYTFPLVPFLFATALAVNGLRRRSLSPSGAAAAFLTGISMLSLPLRTPGIALIAFYLAGSRATRVGRARKAALEDGHDGAGGGYRSAMQVFANSASALAATLLWGALHAPAFPEGRAVANVLGARRVAYNPEKWCPADARVSGGWSRALLFVVLGHFACCLGDTLASELGILSPSAPFLITTFRRVPPGTNGGMSLLGTAASIGGGIAMAISMSATLLAENVACRAHAFILVRDLLFWGALAGGLGSLLDSFLGATLQRTQYSDASKQILTDTSDPSKSVAPDVKTVSGINILTNNQVNLISSTVIAIALGYFA